MEFASTRGSRPEENGERDHFLSNTAYEVAKWIALIFLPSIGTLYVALAAIWGFPNPQEVVSTLIAIEAFIGAIIKLSDHSYNKSEAKYDGSIDVTEHGDKTLYSLNLKDDPEKIALEKEILFKVNVTVSPSTT